MMRGSGILGSLSAADGDDYFNVVTVSDDHQRMLAFRHDFAVTLHRHPFTGKTALFEHCGDGHWLGKSGGFAIDLQRNHGRDFTIGAFPALAIRLKCGQRLKHAGVV